MTAEEVWIEDHGIQYQADAVIAGSRIGVAYAGEHAHLPYRFFIKGNKYVSKPAKIQPPQKLYK